MGPLEDGVEWETSASPARAASSIACGACSSIPRPTRSNGQGQRGRARRPTRSSSARCTRRSRRSRQAVTDLRFNTAISEMMVFVNEATKAPAIPRAWFEMFVKILVAVRAARRRGDVAAPRSPHDDHVRSRGPRYDEAKLARDTMVIARPGQRQAARPDRGPGGRDRGRRARARRRPTTRSQRSSRASRSSARSTSRAGSSTSWSRDVLSSFSCHSRVLSGA